MNLLNLLINLVVAAILVVLAFWLIGLLAASVALPLVAIMLFKVFVVLIAIGWVLGFFGSPVVTWR
jgi:hypothetical protein